MGTKSGDGEEVTAPVTPRKEDEPWLTAGLTKEQWDALEIPAFLLRQGTALDQKLLLTAISASRTIANAPDADGSAGKQSGMTGGFERFRVDPNEIESRIKQEADRRWREWVPTKEHLKRPRKSYYEKVVRKDYYP